MVLLSICIPTFNRSAYLAETLHRCISDIEDGNLSTNVEILVGDNASSDDTSHVCLDLVSKYQFIYYIKNKENIGGERNWLNLINLATGRYVWILSDDDDFLPGLVADIIQILEKLDYAAIFLNYNFFEDIDKNKTFGMASKYYVDDVGVGRQSFFQKTEFASSFISSNIFNRACFLENLPTIDLYKGNPWLQLYVVDKIVGENSNYYYYSTPKLKMRAVSVEDSRSRAHMQGLHHFYFNAHMDFIEFLDYLNWGDSDIKKKMIASQFSQIMYERKSWYELTGREDYQYWFLMIKKFIALGYFNKTATFWYRDIFLMLIPFKFISMVNYLFKIKHKVGIWIRACEGSRDVFKKYIFFLYSWYRRR